MIASPRRELDEAIDRVAAKLVAVDEDAAVLRRVMARLPERKATPWFMAKPVQLAAATALVIIAFVFARPSHELVSIAALPLAERAAVIEPRPVEVSPQLVAAPIPDPRFHLRQGSGGQARLPAMSIDRSDHERSLPPVDAAEAIELVGIATPSIDVESATAIEPIVLTELALEPQGDS